MYKVKEITSDVVLFENGYRLEHSHEQDCCESNYADFTSLKDTTFESDIHEDIVFERSGNGVRVNGHYVNCYSFQNGYYSNEITIELLNDDGVVKSINTYSNIGVLDY